MTELLLVDVFVALCDAEATAAPDVEPFAACTEIAAVLAADDPPEPEPVRPDNTDDATAFALLTMASTLTVVELLDEDVEEPAVVGVDDDDDDDELVGASVEVVDDEPLVDVPVNPERTDEATELALFTMAFTSTVELVGVVEAAVVPVD